MSPLSRRSSSDPLDVPASSMLFDREPCRYRWGIRYFAKSHCSNVPGLGVGRIMPHHQMCGTTRLHLRVPQSLRDVRSEKGPPVRESINTFEICLINLRLCVEPACIQDGDRGGSEEPTRRTNVRRGERRSDNKGIRLKTSRLSRRGRVRRSFLCPCAPSPPRSAVRTPLL